jgi:hypothetical protein
VTGYVELLLLGLSSLSYLCVCGGLAWIFAFGAFSKGRVILFLMSVVFGLMAVAMAADPSIGGELRSTFIAVLVAGAIFILPVVRGLA